MPSAGNNGQLSAAATKRATAANTNKAPRPPKASTDLSHRANSGLRPRHGHLEQNSSFIARIRNSKEVEKETEGEETERQRDTEGNRTRVFRAKCPCLPVGPGLRPRGGSR